MKKRVLVGVALVMLALIGVAIARQRLSPLPAESKTAIVRRGDLSTSVMALGQVQPQRSVNLSLRVSGTVDEVLVKPGDHVSKGDLLLVLENWEYQQAVSQAERAFDLAARQLLLAQQPPSSAEIKIASARLRRATVARQHAQQAYDDLSDDPDAESSDESLDLEIAKLEYELAQAELDRVLEGSDDLSVARAEADVAQAEASLAQAQRRLESTHLATPIDGTVMRVAIQAGENLGAFGPAVTVADLSALEIRAEIDELDIGQVEAGQAVAVTLDAMPGETWASQVMRIEPGVSDTRGTASYQAIINLDEWPAAVRPGMGANLDITTGTVQDVLIVPREAVKQAGRYEYVRLVSGRQIQEVRVITGLSDGSNIQILEGLVEGQMITID